ncbi:hypothetical protein GH714_007493 [Hevea brasiliensis]|uniref:Uncharacterized protein n=1 Tax=Hevea brasiliensis TaxID=3981 RepID=A0A6A6N1I6_HEVBR|nr:hypothetical protein GH714_007493 [Hevea brasiliensis]
MPFLWCRQLRFAQGVPSDNFIRANQATGSRISLSSPTDMGRYRHSSHHVPMARKPQAPLTASVEVSDTNGINSGILLGADSSFNGNAFFERYFRTYEEVLSLVSSESDHATLEVADICDVDDSLGDIPLPTSPEIYFSTRHYELKELFQKAQSYMVHAREREDRVKAIKGKVDN